VSDLITDNHGYRLIRRNFRNLEEGSTIFCKASMAIKSL
jgi:hypothetical protein